MRTTTQLISSEKLERITQKSVERCQELDKLIADLGKAIEFKAAEWKNLTASLKDVDDRALAQSKVILASLHQLKSDKATTVANAKTQLVKFEDKLGKSEREFRKAKETIANCTEAVKVIEDRLEREEVMLEQISLVTKRMFWVALSMIVVLSLLVTWWIRRSSSSSTFFH
ncbi:hypothetical protein T439DRAFT_34299 [Meredithblackwellia eburnea MCA 4105]